MIPLQTASPHPVTHIVFSPDGAAVAVAQPHHGVTLIERATGRTRTVCAMPRRGALTGLTFCGAGKFLATASAKGLEVFEAATGVPVFQNSHGPQKFHLAVRGDVVLGCPPRSYTALRPMVKATDTITGPDSTKAILYRGALTFVTCAPDGSHVLSTDGNRLVLLNVASDRTVAEIELPVNEPTVIPLAQFCPLGRRFALTDGRTLDVYDPTGLSDDGDDPPGTDDPPVEVAPMPHTLLAPVFTLRSDRPGVERDWYPPFALLADGRGLLMNRVRNRVQLWDAPTGTLMNEWSWRFEGVTCVAVSADGLTAVAGGRFGRVLLWDLE